MRKTILLIVLILAVLPLAGCMGAESIEAPYGAIPLADMPPVPAGLVQPIPDGYEVVSEAQTESRFAYGSRTILVRYAIAPGAASVINNAQRENIEAFARQYVSSAYDDIGVDTIEFMGENALIVTAIPDEDSEHDRADYAAVYAIAPFGDYFVMVSGYAPRAELDVIRWDVEAFLEGFTISD